MPQGERPTIRLSNDGPFISIGSSPPGVGRVLDSVAMGPACGHQFQENISCFRLSLALIIVLSRSCAVFLDGILFDVVAKRNTGFCYGWRSFNWLLLPMALQVFFCGRISANHKSSPRDGNSWSVFARSCPEADQSAHKSPLGPFLASPAQPDQQAQKQCH